MGIFADLGFKKNSSGQIVAPNSAKISGKSVAELQTELVNRVNSDIVLSPDVDGVATITSFANVNKADFFNDNSNVATYFFDGNTNDAKGTYNGTKSGGSYSTGKFNQCLYFPSEQTSYFDTLSKPLNGSSTYSISVWLKMSTNGWCSIYNTTGTSGWGKAGPIFLVDGSNIAFTHSNGLGTNNGYVSVAKSIDNLWHHYVAVRNGSTIQLYKDGVLRSTGTLSNTTTTQTDNARVGLFYDGTVRASCDKSFDNLRLFNKALSAAEVTSLYNETVPSNTLVQADSQNNWYKYQATAYDLTAGAKLFINGSEQIGTVSGNITTFDSVQTNTRQLTLTMPTGSASKVDINLYTGVQA